MEDRDGLPRNILDSNIQGNIPNHAGKMKDEQENDSQSLNSKERNKNTISDEDENETIFDIKSNSSSLLNSLFPVNIKSDNQEGTLSNSKAICDSNEISNFEKKHFEVTLKNETNDKEESAHVNRKTYQQNTTDLLDIELNSDNRTSVTSNQHSPDNVTEINISSRNSRATLIEDSKLVKIGLSTNPINLVQSNTQLLNKSRNFINFITEKSSNIMEKTLLQPHITSRYNSLLKLTDSYVKKIPEELCTSSESSSSDLTSSSETDLTKIPRTTDTLPQFETVEFRDDSESCHSTNLTVGSSDSMGNSVKNNCPSALNSETITVPESQGSRPSSEENSENDNSYREDSVDSAISQSPNNGIMNNSMYLSLLREYKTTKRENEILREKITKLEVENQHSEINKNEDCQREGIASMEKCINRLKIELKNSLANQETLSREYAAANKERECMVMKYAVGEKQLIDAQKARDSTERKLKDITKEYEIVQNRLRQSQSERSRICSILDNKCSELTDLQKQVDRLKEDINMKDVKLKWTQNKLKSEIEMQKETQHKLDAAMIKINEMKEECEQVRRETQETIRKFQCSEENKAISLDQQLKEQQAQLILERHVIEDKESHRLQLQKEVETLQNRQQVLIEENNSLSLKIQELEENRLSYENNLSNLKTIADQREKEIADLTIKVSQLETLKVQLKHQEQCLASTEAEVRRLGQINQELQIDMDACRQREANMLEFTQKLTDKNVRLQSEFTAMEARNQRFEKEQSPLQKRISELTARVKSLEESLASEEKRKLEDCEILAKHLAEQTQLVQDLKQKLEDSEGENAVLKRKHQVALKEMSKELQQSRKRLEAFESLAPGNTLEHTSRTGLSSSLSTGETSADHNSSVDHSLNSVEKQSLIDKIIRMQKVNVKKSEKIDFLEEHIQSLVEELQRKTKIIQNYIIVENFDAMSTNERDKNKAELARYGGIMASVYNHKVSDDHMTLELSLEINQKLQSVLEDTLLKNITLKDNIDTLGEEIAKLTLQLHQKQDVK